MPGFKLEFIDLELNPPLEIIVDSKLCFNIALCILDAAIPAPPDAELAKWSILRSLEFFMAAIS
jgi:hypothetical protein